MSGSKKSVSMLYTNANGYSIMPREFISVIECVHSLSEFCLRTKSRHSPEDFIKLKRIFITLSNHHSFDQIRSWFKLQDGQIIPLECLWLLHSHNFIHFTTYIYYNTNLIPQLSECFDERIWCEDERLQQECAETVAGLLAVLVNLGAHSSRDICQPGQQLLALIVEKALSKLSFDDVTSELSRIVLSEEQFNWRWLLTAVSVLAASSVPGVESLKGVTEGWVSQACANKNLDLLSLALLSARQCCAESHERFGSYSTWFGNLQLKSSAAFSFFFNFLSQLVPYEPVLCLKIHVNKVPQAPSNCHGVVADYAALAKTRLADLNQTTDYVGLFGEYTTTEQEGREADVAKVISSFKQTKEVMKVVLEASVFRRQFYEKVFLAELLKDTNSDHVEFIEKLYSIGKVPHGLYSKWRQLHC